MPAVRMQKQLSYSGLDRVLPHARTCSGDLVVPPACDALLSPGKSCLVGAVRAMQRRPTRPMSDPHRCNHATLLRGTCLSSGARRGFIHGPSRSLLLSVRGSNQRLRSCRSTASSSESLVAPSHSLYEHPHPCSRKCCTCPACLAGPGCILRPASALSAAAIAWIEPTLHSCRSTASLHRTGLSSGHDNRAGADVYR
jgi:hypothetical protein